jgi:hypothetical protein
MARRSKSKKGTGTAHPSAAGTAEKKHDKPTTKPSSRTLDMTSECDGMAFAIIGVPVPPGSKFANGTDTANSRSEATTAEKKDEKPTKKPSVEIVDMTGKDGVGGFGIVGVPVPPGSKFVNDK